MEFGSTKSGLFAVADNSKLYSISPTTGQASLIGATGVPIPFNTGSAVGLSNNSDILYMSSQTNLYSLNTGTGVASLIGSTGTLQFNPMMELNGILYGGAAVPLQAIASLNTSTGHATQIAPITGVNGFIYALAPVPEPSTWMYMIAGLAITSVIKKRKWHSI